MGDVQCTAEGVQAGPPTKGARQGCQVSRGTPVSSQLTGAWVAVLTCGSLWGSTSPLRSPCDESRPRVPRAGARLSDRLLPHSVPCGGGTSTSGGREGREMLGRRPCLHSFEAQGLMLYLGRFLLTLLYILGVLAQTSQLRW